MAIWIKTDGTITVVDPKAGPAFKLQELQEHVGGYIEVVRLQEGASAGKWLIVDEEGCLKEKPFNGYASFLAKQTIVGNALLVSYREMEGREEWEPEEVEEEE